MDFFLVPRLAEVAGTATMRHGLSGAKTVQGNGDRHHETWPWPVRIQQGTYTAHKQIYKDRVMQLQRLSGTQTYQHRCTETYISTLAWTHRDIHADTHTNTQDFVKYVISGY